MQINYHDWFLKSHHYLTGTRDGVTTYNDTKWVTLNKRLETLIGLNSELIKYQPYNVVGNYTAFKRLMDLMEKSNYTFEDMDQSLIKTYKMSLQNAMSSMVVNTHAVIAHYSSSDKKHVTPGRTDRFYTIDVPYAQLHFGDRDEFIRQRLHEFYETENGYFMDSDRFLSKYISDILGFTLICTVNGLITDDWKVAIDEKGFRFKIGWSYVEKADFIIYKLDKAFVTEIELDKDDALSLVSTKYISLEKLGFDKQPELIDAKCIFHMCDSSVKESVSMTPNFGIIKESGFDAKGVQSRTTNDINSGSSSKVRLRLYVLKYLFELPDFYPMINFYGMICRKHVYDSKHNHITNPDGGYILTEYNASSDASNNVCSPPISVDRVDDDNLMSTFVDAVYMYDSLMRLSSNVNEIAAMHDNLRDITYSYLIGDIKAIVGETYEQMQQLYAKYLNICITTNLVDIFSKQAFDNFMKQFGNYHDIVMEAPTQYDKYAYEAICNNIPEILTSLDPDFYPSEFVDVVTKPFTDEPTITRLREALNGNRGVGFFFDPGASERHHSESSRVGIMKDRINRPISEQCFIALRYDVDESCWKFAAPKINHFKGISNTFYIRDKAEEGRTYKFMILYTDTENPSEEKIKYFTDEQLMDFDKFMDEVEAHLGYIKYWNVESRLMKLSKLMYGQNDIKTQIAILSRILDRKMDSEWLDEYPSIINYEISNVSSDNVGAGEYEVRAPFALNFMFYTVSQMYDNKDQLQAYFLRQLTSRQFHPRYADLTVDKINTDLTRELVNYSIITKGPSIFSTSDRDISVFPEGSDYTVYNGFPYVLDETHGIHHMSSDNEYLYMFNQYEPSIELPLISDTGIDPYYHIKFVNLTTNGVSKVHYYDDPRVASMMSTCIAELSEIVNQIQTNYKTTWDQSFAVSSAIQIIEKWSDRMEAYMSGDDVQFKMLNTLNYPGTAQMYTTWFDKTSNSGLMKMFVDIKTKLDSVRDPSIGGVLLEQITQNVLSETQYVHKNFGYDYDKTRYARAVYIHMKNITEPLSTKAVKDWAQILQNFDQGNDPNFDVYNGLMKTVLISPIKQDINERYRFSVSIDELRERTFNPNISNAITQFIPELETLYAFNAWWNEFAPIYKSYFMALINNFMFDLYAIDDMELPLYFGSVDVNAETPIFVTLTIPKTDAHVTVPSEIAPASTNVTLLFRPIYDQGDIVTLHPVCNYAFFDGTDLTVDGTTVTMKFYFKDGSEASSVIDAGLVIKFKKVASSSDVMSDFDQYIGCQTIPLEVQNIHETFDVLPDKSILNEKHAKLNYELLAGNKFAPLDYDSEFIMNSHSGPHDKLFLKCDQINRYATTDMSGQPTTTWYFKPCQVQHLKIESGYMNSLGSGYFEGQTIYAYTDDGLCVFPMIIIAIDHSEEHGFVEAKVDEFNAPWFRTSDMSVIEKYLDITTPITCTVVDDNIRNFMDEYSEYDGPYYPIPQVSSTVEIPSEWNDVYTLPGDPVYVVSNSEYVYTRLNWMFNDEIPNRIDGTINPLHHFVYLGDIAINEVARSADLKLLYHDFDSYTTPEKYPVLREEPDDHYVWKQEHLTFKQQIAKAEKNIATLKAELNAAESEYQELLHPHILKYSTVMIKPGAKSEGVLIPEEHWSVVWYVDEVLNNPIRVKLSYTDDPVPKIGDIVFVKPGAVGITGASLPPEWSTYVWTIYQVNGAVISIRASHDDTLTETLINVSQVIHMVEDATDPSGYKRGYQYVIYQDPPYILNENDVMVVQREFRKKERAIKLHIEAINRDIEYWEAFIKRMELYDIELETPTKWYNVNSYDAAMVYIDNGRARMVPVRKTALRDIVIGHAQLRLYDWEHKCWLTPGDYIFSIQGYENRSDVYGDYSSPRVRDTLNILLLDPTFNSKKILVYMVYDNNTPWSEIEPGSMDCEVTFKPVMVVNPKTDINDLYHKIRVRKHYDESETYRLINLDSTPDDFPLEGGIMLTRPDRSGTYKYGSPIRFCDMKVVANDVEMPFSDFDIYVRNPMNHTEVPMYHIEREYNTLIAAEIDGFEPNHHVLLVSVKNDEISEFNGASSNIMFEGITAIDEGQPVITITSSTLPNSIVGTFVCTVVPDGTSPMSGGLVHVVVTEARTPSPLTDIKYMIQNASPANSGTGYGENYVRLMLVDSTLSKEVFKTISDDEGHVLSVRNLFSDGYTPGQYPLGPDGALISIDYESTATWTGESISTIVVDGSAASGLTLNVSDLAIRPIEEYRSTNWVNLYHDQEHRDVAYKIIPKQIILVPKDPTFDVLSISEIRLKNQYVLNSDGSDDIKSDTLDAPFTYYYDKKHDVRYPIGNVLKNRASERLVIDTETSTDVSTIRSNHISVCRYASHVIPQDGIIDLTGYIPTPLSRDRYEFWVNGKYVDDPDIIIISPTSFQLRNMTSLHNLEVIELVDDISDTELMPKGPVYVDLNGNTYGSYHSMLVYKANIIDQSIKYQFNQSTKAGIDDYLASDVRASGNRDYEPDILSYVQIDEEEPTSYEELYHIPTINGQTIFHATTQTLGLIEMTNKQVIDTLDRTWKKEILNGVIPITHNGKLKTQSNATQFLHVIRRDDHFEIYTSGTFDRPFTLYLSTTKTGKIQNATTTVRIMPMLRAGTHVILAPEFENLWVISTVPDTTPVQIK